MTQLSLFDEKNDPIFQQDFEKGVKFCNTCKKDLPVAKFSFWWSASYGKDKRNSSCRDCTNEHRKILDNIKLHAPPRPDYCQCCGITVEELKKRGNNRNYGSIQVDHDHDTHEFRGWICYSCNQGIGKLGDKLKGVVQAALYLAQGDLNIINQEIKKLMEDK